MPMHITKSLFKEFAECPKLARRHINDKKTYKYINEQQYWSMDAIAIWQEVEDMVAQLRKQEDVAEVNTQNISFKDRHNIYNERTMKVFSQRPKIISQPWLKINNLFIKSDFLLLNDDGKYDLIEVKSKNNIYKKTKAAPLLDDLIYDVSFQDYVLKKTLWDLYSWKAFIYHINKEFIKQWDIVPSQIISREDVTEELLDTETIEQLIEIITTNIQLPLAQFSHIYPYNWENPLLYRGKKPTIGSIFTIPRITQSKKNLLNFYESGKLQIKDLDDDDIEALSWWKPDSNFTKFINLYNQGRVVNKQAIKERLGNLDFPLFFYDYESVSNPIPMFNWSHPRQHMIVQYSLHRMDADGTITHYESLIREWEQNNKRVIADLIRDMWNQNGTYIVRYKGFENSRNNETAIMYPEFADALQKINNQTFDLMDIFKDMQYFDKAFLWSSSIKKVLPVLTDISYDNLTVGNGWLASGYLSDLVRWKLPTNISIENLLEYCKQDTRAMVEIYRVVLDAIK